MLHHFLSRALRHASLMMACAGVCSGIVSCSCGHDEVVQMQEDTIETADSSDIYNHHIGYMPDDSCVKLHVNGFGPLARAFNDSNYIHINSAQDLGISPIATNADAWNLRRPVVKIVSCRDFFVDTLTHSLPYLVPEAAQLLHEIGRRFRDTLHERGGGEYRIKVTSILRTRSSIASLRRRNSNAVDTSAHQFGTTFDISYFKFICDSASSVQRTQEDLKNLLGEILYGLRDEGRCYVKYERKQSCFHITTRRELSNPLMPI